MGTKARRTFTARFKLDAVLELLAGHKSVAQICRERNITDKLLYDWKRAFLERAPSLFETGAAATSEMHTRIAELDRMVGRLTMENDILNKGWRELAVPLERKRAMIQQLGGFYPIATVCAVLECPRRSYYYQAAPTNNEALRTAIEQIVIRWPYYGYRRVTAPLRREGWTINSKVVRRLMHEFSVHGRIGRVRWHTTDSTHDQPRYPNLVRDLTVAYPDQLWVADITYLRLGHRFIYLAVILDTFSRAVRGWHLGRSLGQELAVTALEQALTHRVPGMHHSDQGVQYAAKAYIDRLTGAGVQISMAEAGQPTQNALAERFMRTLKEEHVDYTEYTDFNDAERQLRHWLEVEYNHQRIHSALGYAPPTEFEATFWTATRSAPSYG